MLSSSPGVRVLFLAAGAGGIRLFQPILSGEQQAQLVPWQCLRRLDLDSLVAGGFGWFEIAVRIRQQASRPLGIQQWQGGGHAAHGVSGAGARRSLLRQGAQLAFAVVADDVHAP